MHRFLFRLALIVSLAALVSTARADRGAGSTYDTVVVGAGPGGLMAALQAHADLKAAGKTPKVLVLEKRGARPKGARFDDSKALAKTAFSRQQIIGLKPQVVADLAKLGVKIPSRYRIKTMRSVATGGDAIPQHNPHPNVSMSPEVKDMVAANSTHVIRINELQSLLADAAAKRGIKIDFNSGIESLAQKSKRVDVGVESKRGTRKVRARYVIGADGAGSHTRKLAGMDWIQSDKHGYMAGVWFKGIRGKNRIVYPKTPMPGESGVLLGDRSQVYGLFALPSHLGNLLEKAKAQERPLSGAEKQKIMAHAEKVARKMLEPGDAAKIKADSMLSFPVALNRAASAVNGRVVIAGDAVQTVNPYTGMGANVAMKVARLAAKAVVAADTSRRPGLARQKLASYGKRAVGAAKAMHNLCIPLRKTFRSPGSHYKRTLRKKARAVTRKSRRKHKTQRRTMHKRRRKPARQTARRGKARR